MWRVIVWALLSFSLVASSQVSTQAQVLQFAATGCGPYADDEEPLLEHYVDLVNSDGQSEFLVHLGDVVTGSKKQWPESQYAKVANTKKAGGHQILSACKRIKCD